MNDDALRRSYARHLADRGGSGRERCVPPEALLAVLERSGNDASRLATLDHVGACAACARDLDLLRAVFRAGAPTPAPKRAWMPSHLGRFAAAAALVLTVGGVTMLARGPRDAVMRGGATELRPIAPNASAPAPVPVVLSWHGLPSAVSYEVEILSFAGDSLFKATTSDTSLTVPPSVALAADEEYLWSVRARLRDATQTSGASLRFRVRRP